MPQRFETLEIEVINQKLASYLFENYTYFAYFR